MVKTPWSRFLVLLVGATVTVGCKVVEVQVKDPSLVSIVDYGDDPYVFVPAGNAPARYVFDWSKPTEHHPYVARRTDGSIVMGDDANIGHEQLLVSSDGRILPCDPNRDDCVGNPLGSVTFRQGGYGVCARRRFCRGFLLTTPSDNVTRMTKRSLSPFDSLPEL